jgi:hypothetical protein
MRNLGYAVGDPMLPHQVHRYEKIIGRSVNVSTGVGVLTGVSNAIDGHGSTAMGDVEVGTLEYDHQLLTDSRMPSALNLAGSAMRSVNIDQLTFTGGAGERSYFCALATNAGKLTLGGYLKHLVVKNSAGASYGGVRIHDTADITLAPGFALDDLDFPESADDAPVCCHVPF